MRLTRNVLLLTFAVFWAVISAHCKWEALSGLEILQCESTEGESHCEVDSCDDVEDGQFFQVQRSPLESFKLVALPYELLSALSDVSTQPLSEPVPKAIPDLPGPWQFVYRTALPVRAPSFVS